MKNGVNENVLILTGTFSCAISVSEEEIIIKKNLHMNNKALSRL